MIKIVFGQQGAAVRQVLCLGAHSDDIEIGCGGALLRLIEENPDLSVTWVVFSALKERVKEAQDSANQFLASVADKRILIKDFKDGFFPYIGGDIKEFFEQLKLEISPDLIFTHYRHDLHQDHRLLAELTWNTFRNHLILEYEIPKFDGDLGAPNLFFPLKRATCDQKIGIILNAFQTQNERDWFTTETFSALLRLRGVECHADSGYAEAFYCRKIVI